MTYWRSNNFAIKLGAVVVVGSFGLQLSGPGFDSCYKILLQQVIVLLERLLKVTSAVLHGFCLNILGFQTNCSWIS